MELLTPKELRKQLNISETHYWTLIREGMPGVPIGKRTRRFDIDAVLAWLKERGGDDEAV